MLPGRLLLLTLVASAVLASPVLAQSDTERRDAAEETLQEAQRLADGRGIRTGRELSVVLAELAAARSDLSSSDRREADALLARPVDTADVTQPGGPYDPRARILRNCSAHFCVHWVDSTADAPSLSNADSCPTPDYIDRMRLALEQSYEVENGQLGWKPPVSDAGRGGNDLTDVYVKELNSDPTDGLYGYAAPDSPQSARSRYAFLVLDDDYAEDEFPQYDGNDRIPVQVTAAHEYNHVLQFGYDSLQDPWMFESTATWAEEKVFPAANDYVGYMGTWADGPLEPITDATSRMYGSAIWNHWIEQRYGAAVVRRAWELSIAQGGFSPDAYGAAIGGSGVSPELADFAAATAAWEGTDSGIHEGGVFPRVERSGPDLVVGAPDTSFTLHHTAFAPYDVTVPSDSAAPIQLKGTLRSKGATPTAAVGSVALVGIEDGDVTKVIARIDPSTGEATVTMPGDPRRFDRLTAVAVNADVSKSGFNPTTDDWIWSRDNQQATLAVTQPAGATGDDPVEETDHSTPTGPTVAPSCGVTTVEREATVDPIVTPIPTTTPTATPTATPTPPRTSLRLSSSTTKIASAARKGVLALFATTNKAGRLRAKSTVDAVTARRLKIGRRTTSTGTGRRTATAPSRLKINVKLTRKARAALKRQRSRTLRMKVRVTLVPTDGTPAVTRAISLLLRP